MKKTIFVEILSGPIVAEEFPSTENGYQCYINDNLTSRDDRIVYYDIWDVNGRYSSLNSTLEFRVVHKII